MSEQIAVRESMDIEISANDAKKQLQAIKAFQAVIRAEMVEGHDFGKIPGTDKPTLLKPGAEKMAKLLRCSDAYITEEKVEDWDKPFFYYRIKCQLISMTSGVVISEGYGSANSYESKWRYRWIFESEIPAGVAKQTLKRREIYSQKKKRNYVTYRVENDEPFDLVNTILKMAKKRSLVDAALSAGRLSDLFTQDMEDISESDRTPASEPEEEVPTEKPAEKPVEKQKTNGIDDITKLADMLLTTRETVIKFGTTYDNPNKATMAFHKAVTDERAGAELLEKFTKWFGSFETVEPVSQDYKRRELVVHALTDITKLKQEDFIEYLLSDENYNSALVAEALAGNKEAITQFIHNVAEYNKQEQEISQEPKADLLGPQPEETHNPPS